MKTGHLELMNFMESICEPDPQGNVDIEPVMDRIIERYGMVVDDPNFTIASGLSWIQVPKGVYIGMF